MGILQTLHLKKQPNAITVDETHKSKKPPNTAFRQQRLRSWQPILSPQSMIPTLTVIACIFAPIGIALLIAVLRVQHVVLDYSQCDTLASTTGFSKIPSKYVHNYFRTSTDFDPEWKLVRASSDNRDTCQLKFEIPHDIGSPIYMYYKLTNFYQNHRKYVESYDLDQLKGKAVDADSLNDFCKPLRSENGKPIYPCGLIANSMFNDTLSTTLLGADSNTKDYQLSSKNVAWKTDRKVYKKTSYNASDIVPPPNWQKMFPNGYTEENLPDISQWQEFLVWMRTAGLPSFYKLSSKNEKDTLPAGTYTMEIELNYPVSYFGGTKSFVLTTNSVIGGRNVSLGVVYLIVAGVCLLFGAMFLMKVIFKPRKLGDHSYLNFGHNGDQEGDNSSARNLNEQLTPLRDIL